MEGFQRKHLLDCLLHDEARSFFTDKIGDDGSLARCTLPPEGRSTRTPSAARGQLETRVYASVVSCSFTAQGQVSKAQEHAASVSSVPENSALSGQLATTCVSRAAQSQPQSSTVTDFLSPHICACWAHALADSEHHRAARTLHWLHSPPSSVSLPHPPLLSFYLLRVHLLARVPYRRTKMPLRKHVGFSPVCGVSMSLKQSVV